MTEKACTRCKVIKPLDQFYKNRQNRDGLSCQCKACNKEQVRAWTKRNKGRVAVHQKESIIRNAEAFRERRRRYRALVKARDPHTHWMHKRICNVQRFFALARATPRWVRMEDIIEIHKRAAEMQRRDGIKYHVDHIHPICGKNSCGLNVPWNLQVIPAQENLLKRNLEPVA